MAIIIANTIVNHNLYVIEIFAYQFVLGNDFLKRNNCDILYSSQKLVKTGRSIPIYNYLVNTDFNSIVLSDNFTLIKQTTAIKLCKLTNPHLSVMPYKTFVLKVTPLLLTTTMSKYLE